MPTNQIPPVYRHELEYILAALKEIYGGNIRFIGMGICDNANNLVRLNSQHLFYFSSFQYVCANYYDEWPPFSGDYTYPVPSLIEGYSACQMYHYFRKIGNGAMWDKTNSYGYHRWNLVEFLINKIEEDLNNG